MPNDIETGGTSTLQPPGGGPSNTPAPTGINDPFASTNLGSGTGAPTAMPKQDISGLIGMLSSEIYRARLATHEGRAKLEASDTILNRVAAELAAIERNPPDRQLRFAQQAFFPMLLTMIAQAKSSIGTDAQANQNAVNFLTQAEWIAGQIRQI